MVLIGCDFHPSWQQVSWLVCETGETGDPEAVRVAQVRQLFRAGSYPDSETGVLIFFAWLEKNRRELLPRDRVGDPYQHLKVDLAGLFKD